MYVDYDVIEAAATLIQAGLGELPVEGEAEWRSFDEENTETLKAVIAELGFGDIAAAVRAAADRLPEPADEGGGAAHTNPEASEES